MIGKAFLPKSLFGRALLILVLPTVLIQLVVAYIFFDRHWDNIIRHMSRSLAGETALLISQIETLLPDQRTRFIATFEFTTGVEVFFESRDYFAMQAPSDEYPDFQERLRNILNFPFTIRKSSDGSMIEICVLMPDMTLRLETTVKRLESRTTTIFLAWMLGASALFLLIAIVFLRNQIRPITRLATAADNFGRGVEIADFRPSGATEVRKAARAFIVMRERIKRQLRTRTEMLAGISHDLRTPLTRMKLQLAMLKQDEATRELNDDVQQMEHMIQEYLDFARGEGREELTARISLREIVADIVNDYSRQQADVVLTGGDDAVMDIRIVGFRRMLHNIIDNALRYGKRCNIKLKIATNYAEIVIDDEGPGIPAAMHEEVFKPFARLDPSRNIKTGGVGLGLSIARDIAQAHGGGISLEDSPAGGLRVVIRLPL